MCGDGVLTGFDLSTTQAFQAIYRRLHRAAPSSPLLHTRCCRAWRGAQRLQWLTRAAQVLNIVGLAVEHYPHSETFAAVLSTSNTVFLCICAPRSQHLSSSQRCGFAAAPCCILPHL